VAFTYNDPVIFMEYAVDVAQACRERDIKTVDERRLHLRRAAVRIFPSHGRRQYRPQGRFTEGFYKNLCSGRLQPVLETLEYLKHSTDVWFEITTLLIPGENDAAAEINVLCHWVIERLGPDVPLHFSAFHPDWKMLETPPTPPATLRMARRIGKEVGLRYVYTGNVHDPEGQSTYCRGCEALLIGRDWYELTAWHLTGGSVPALRNAMRRRVRADPRPMGPTPSARHRAATPRPCRRTAMRPSLCDVMHSNPADAAGIPFTAAKRGVAVFAAPDSTWSARTARA